MSARCAVVVLLLAGTSFEPLAGQDGVEGFGRPGSIGAAWTSSWSALAPIADLPRTLPGAPAPTDLLRVPLRPVGVFWIAGNPAGLVRELSPRHGHLELRHEREEGSHRRPLETDDVSSTSFRGVRWQPLGSSGALAGSIGASHTTLSDGSHSPAITRYGSDPFVLTDTTSTAMRHTRARLDGAYSLALGSWSAGLTLGVAVSDGRTIAARLPRQARSSLWGATAGVAHTLGGDRATLSAHARRTGGVESALLFAYPHMVGVVLPLTGYAEPEPIEINNRIFREHVERSATAFAGAASLALGGVDWTGFAELIRREDQHVRVRRANERGDLWEANGWRVGGALKTALMGEALDIVVSGAYERLDGDGTRRDLDEVSFRALESHLGMAGEVRYAPTGPWVAALAGTFHRQTRARSDLVVGLRTDVRTSVPGVALELARVIAPRTTVAFGASAAFSETLASLPNPDAQGPLYRQLLAPELSAYTAPVAPLAGTLTLRRDAGAAAFLLSVRTWTRSGTPDSASEAETQELERSGWSASLGAVWER